MPAGEFYPYLGWPHVPPGVANSLNMEWEKPMSDYDYVNVLGQVVRLIFAAQDTLRNTTSISGRLAVTHLIHSAEELLDEVLDQLDEVDGPNDTMTVAYGTSEVPDPL